MWLFTQYGFYSVVQHNENPDAFLVRARIRNDLENLLRLAQIEATIMETPRADYAHRIFLSRAEWEHTAQILASAVDYPNFKDRVHELPDQSTKNAAYMNIWSALRKVEQPSAAQIESEDNALRKAILAASENDEENSVYAVFQEAENLMQSGEVEQAIEHADFLIAHAPEFPMSYILKGFALSKYLDRHDEAVEVLREGLRLLPEHDGAWRMLALSLIQAGHFLEAVEVLGGICEREADAFDARILQGFAYALAHGLRTPAPFVEWINTHNLSKFELQDGATLYLFGLHLLCAGLQNEAREYIATVRQADEQWADELQRALDGASSQADEETPQWEKDNIPLREAMARFGEHPQGEGLEIVIRALQSGWAALVSERTEYDEQGTHFSLAMNALPQLDGEIGIAAFTSRESSRRFVGNTATDRIVQGGDSLIDLVLQTHAATGQPTAIVLDAAGPQACVIPIDALQESPQDLDKKSAPLEDNGKITPQPRRTLPLLESRGLLQSGDALDLIKLPKQGITIPDAARRATYLGNSKVLWHMDDMEYTLSALCGEIVRRFGGGETPGTFRGPDYWAKSNSTVSLTQLASS